VPGQVVEIRALEASLDQNNRYTRTYGGYFDNPDDSIKAISTIRFAMGIYLTLHPCTPDILHRAKNKLVEQRKDSSTADKNITRLKWFPIDCDPERVSGISSTDEEHEKALAMCRKIREALGALGWPDPILADSGNGFHLLYPIDLPTSDSQLLKRALEGLQQFNEDDVHVDQTLFNPSRIIKLYGTLACKGDNTAERPHRLSRMLEVPEQMQVVPRELLEAIAVPNEQPKEPATKASSNGHKNRKYTREDFSLDGFIAKHGIRTKSSGPYNGGTRHLLEACAWDPSHTDNSACLYDMPDGLGASCSHNSCQGKHWRDYRLVFEPTAYDKKQRSGDSETSADHAALLVDMALSKAEVFATPKGEVYARIRIKDRFETIPVSDKGVFKRWLMHEYRQSTGIIPQATALISAVEVLVAEAEWGGHEKKDVFVRKAYYQNKIYIDLANKECQVVEVDEDGWRVLKDNIPVCFRRPDGVLPLPVPTRGGKLSEFKQFVNVRDDDDWLLLQAWLLGGYHPEGPYPVLGLNGEGGSAKTSTARRVRMLIDPHEALLRREPKDEQAFAIMAHNSYVVALDNLSRISNKLSDMMCTLSTGAGDAFRKHYTNDEEYIFNAKRPQIFTGIEELATRGDLIDRCIILSLPPIDKCNRRDEKSLDLAFTEAHPRMLGALLDIISLALRNLPHTHLDELPRMADFALWIQAAEEAITDEKGAILKAYYQNKEKGIEVELEASPIGKAIIDLMSNSESWHGTTTELLQSLNGRVDEKTTYQREWPKNARALSGLLKRITPSFRVKGIIITQGRGNGGSWVTITKKSGDSCDANRGNFASPENPFASPENPFASPENPFASPENPFASPENGSSTDFDPLVTQSDAKNTVSNLSENPKKEDRDVERNDTNDEKNSGENLRHFASPTGSIPDDFTYEENLCPTCACGLSRQLEGSQVCVRCYPPKGYHAYSELVDMIYPRKQKPAFGKGGAQ
jgi:hypothetical protein